MDIKPQTIRTGNLFEYYIEEEKKWEPTQLDWQDIEWCELYESSFNKVHRPIPLTEDWLERFGFKIAKRADQPEYAMAYIGENPLTLDFMIALQRTNKSWFYNNAFHTIDFVHELQDLFFVLVGTELVLQERGEKV